MQSLSVILQRSIIRSNFSRQSKAIAITRHFSSFHQSKATLISPNNTVPEHVFCAVGIDPADTVIVDKRIATTLAGHDLGPGCATLDLMFYDGRHFSKDGKAESPCLTLDKASACLMNVSDGEAVLFHDGGSGVKGSAIALKGSKGEAACKVTANGIAKFRKALEELL